MAIANIITRGIGPQATVPLLITAGFVQVAPTSTRRGHIWRFFNYFN